MTQLVFFVEERSMRVLLVCLLPRLAPSGPDVVIVEHEGKTDLKRSLGKKLVAWQGQARFVVLIDQDSSNCKKLKKEIGAICAAAGCERPLIRVVCRSLESWILGDLEAVGVALGKRDLGKQQVKAKFRNPDRLADPIKELRSFVPTYQKVAGARAVGPHLRLDVRANSSISFQHFLTGLTRLFGEVETMP